MVQSGVTGLGTTKNSNAKKYFDNTEHNAARKAGEQQIYSLEGYLKFDNDEFRVMVSLLLIMILIGAL